MEIVNKNVAFLSNCEVYTLLKQTKEELAHKLSKKKLEKQHLNTADQIQTANLSSINVDKHLPTIVYESLRYLERTPCIHQSPEIVNDFLRKCQERESEFKLTKIEKLAIINHRPQTAVELQVLIEDAEERFTVDQIDQLVDFVLTNLPVDNAAAATGDIAFDQAAIDQPVTSSAV